MSFCAPPNTDTDVTTTLTLTETALPPPIRYIQACCVRVRPAVNVSRIYAADKDGYNIVGDNEEDDDISVIARPIPSS
jgi:hypothetical protein